MCESLPLLSLPTQEFSELRIKNQIYVDKTKLICRLASPRSSGWFFLSRPRRFGKTLLISTLEALFKQKVELFKGLYAESHWPDAGSYTVLRLNFARMQEVDTADEFFERFKVMTKDACYRAGVTMPVDDELDSMAQFIQFLMRQPRSSIVLLIDEYDSPLTHQLNDPDRFRMIQALIRRFFSDLKDCSENIRFFFMTGITKISQAGIFSGLNNIEDISLDSDYSTILGYTEEEIRQNFSEHLEYSANIRNCTVNEIIDGLTLYYDGYCFDEEAMQHVFCPWSVLHFLAKPQKGFRNYWYASAGKPTVLINHLKSNRFWATRAAETEYFSAKMVSLLGSHELNDITPESLLTQTGYLTIKSVSREVAKLGFPNEEVRASMEQLFADIFFTAEQQDELGFDRIRTPLISGNAEEVMYFINNLVLAADYNDNQQLLNEYLCRFCVQIAFLTMGACTRAEVHNAYGRSDLEVEVPGIRWVFEFKYADSQKSAAVELNRAEKQIIDNHYGEANLLGRKLMRVALVFCRETRMFSQWKVVAYEDATEAQQRIC